MIVTRLPGPSLRPFVKLLWAAERPEGPHGAMREHVLPTGEMHVVFRLAGGPVRLHGSHDDPAGREVGNAIAGGVASSFHVREVRGPVVSVGAQIEPGAAAILFGVTAPELAGKHVSLQELWGPRAGQSLDRLREVERVASRLEILEQILAARLAGVRPLDPAVERAVGRLRAAGSVSRVVEESGWSHRHFVHRFRRAMGTGPKLYLRLHRFQGAVRRLAAKPEIAPAEVALESGYSDQSHFCREFRELAGVTPGEYRALRPARTHHVPIGLPRP